MGQIFFERAADGHPYWQWIASGFVWTLGLALSGWAIAFCLGTLVGIGRTSRNAPLACCARLYVEVFRNVPLLVQMFLWYFVLPEVVPVRWGEWMKQLAPPWGSFVPALLALGLYTASRVAEQVRAGIEALPTGQREASEALGFRTAQVYRYVLVPQALRLIIPSLTSELMAIYKNTSVALTIGLLELTAQARQMSEVTFQTFSAFASATLLYLVIALLASRVMTSIDARAATPGGERAPRVTPGRTLRRDPVQG